MTGERRREFLAWERRASQIREPWHVLVGKFGSPWYGAASGIWIEAAKATGLFEPSDDRESYVTPRDDTHCPLWRKDDRILGHVGDVKGRRYHLLVERSDGGRISVVARWCRKSLSDEDRKRIREHAHQEVAKLPPLSPERVEDLGRFWGSAMADLDRREKQLAAAWEQAAKPQRRPAAPKPDANARRVARLEAEAARLGYRLVPERPES
jgi:hypothetical protein